MKENSRVEITIGREDGDKGSYHADVDEIWGGEWVDGGRVYGENKTELILNIAKELARILGVK